MDNNNSLSNFIDNYVLLWDIVSDDSLVFVPMIVEDSDEKKKRYMLFTLSEDMFKPDDFATHIFLNEKEASSYRKYHEEEGIVFVKMKISNLYKSLNKYFKKHSDKKFKCLLSTIDANGETRELIDVWSNVTNC